MLYYELPLIWFILFDAVSFKDYAEAIPLAIQVVLLYSLYGSLIWKKSNILELFDHLEEIIHQSKFSLFDFHLKFWRFFHLFPRIISYSFLIDLQAGSFPSWEMDQKYFKNFVLQHFILCIYHPNLVFLHIFLCGNVGWITTPDCTRKVSESDQSLMSKIFHILLCLKWNHFLIFSLPYNWKCPIGYAVTSLLQASSILINAMIFSISLSIFSGLCFFSMAMAHDFQQSLLSFNNNLKLDRDCFNIKDRFEFNAKFFKIIEFHGTAKKLVQFISIPKNIMKYHILFDFQFCWRDLPNTRAIHFSEFSCCFVVGMCSAPGIVFVSRNGEDFGKPNVYRPSRAVHLLFVFLLLLW